MIRKGPLRTYQKKKTGQTAICYSQPKLVEPGAFSKRKSSNGKKNKSKDDKTIEEDLSFNLDSTFDRIAKTAKLPPPPLQESHCSLNISSDVPVNELSPLKIEGYEYLWSKEAGNSKATKRAKRKPARSRITYGDELVKNKRFKHDLINTSTKKDKTVKSSRRKAPAKRDKNVTDSRENQEIHFECSTFINSIEPFVIQSAEKTEEPEKHEIKNRFRPRRKPRVNRISSSSSSDSDTKNCDADINTVKTKSKKKKNVRRNAGNRRLKVSDLVDKLREVQVGDEREGEEKNCDIERRTKTENGKGSVIEPPYSVNTSRISTASNRARSKATIKNSSASEFVENFRRYSDSKSRENDDQNPVDLHKYKRILTRKKNGTKTQYKSRRKNKAQKSLDSVDDSDNSDTCENDVAHKKNLANVKTSSVALLESNKNENVMPSPKESAVVIQNCNNHSSQDIFQSSISNTASHIEKETNKSIKIRFQESAVNEQPESIENQSDVVSNSDLDTKAVEAKISKENMGRKLQCNVNRSLRYAKCSTPINASVKIDKTINFLSPITAADGTLHKDRNVEHGKDFDKLPAVNWSRNDNSSNRKCLDLPTTITRRRSTRKKRNVSYKDDKSSESDEYCKENVIENVPVRHRGSGIYTSSDDNSEHTQSLTSQIQESLEILRLSLDNLINEHNGGARRSRSFKKQILSTDNSEFDRISETINKCDDTNEFTGQSKDSCSQLTPVGIITTRSGRQLKLSRTMQKNFLNESNDSEIHSDSDNEIIDDSQTVRNKSLRNRVTKHRGSRFTALKSHSKRKTSKRMNCSDSTDMIAAQKNDSFEIQPAVNESKEHDSTSCKTRTLNDSRKSKRTPLHRRSNRSNPESTKESNYSTSSFDEERNNTRTSLLSDPENEYAKSYNQEILQSIVESTKNLDSLSIRSRSDVPIEISRVDANNKDSEWSTLSGSNSAYSITCNSEDEIQEENRLTNLSSVNSKSLLVCDQNEPIDPLDIGSNNSFKPLDPLDIGSNNSLKPLDPLDIGSNNSFKPLDPLDIGSNNSFKPLDPLDIGSNNSFKPPGNQSPEQTDTALIERLKSLSSRINTRKRRKTVLKPLTENVCQDFEEEIPIETFDHMKLANSFEAYSENGFDLNKDEDIENIALFSAEPKGSDFDGDLLDVHVNRNFQPVVLLERLEDPLRITTNEKKNWHLGLTAIHETPAETSRITSRDPNFLFVPNGDESDQDEDNSEKADPLYCPPENPEIDNSVFVANVIATLQADSEFPNLYINEPEMIDRQSVRESLHDYLLRKSLEDCSLRKPRQPQPKKSKKSDPLPESDASMLKLNRSNKEKLGRKSLFLKPGKEYMRSLSMLNSIRNGSNLEQLSTGKGKNWRKSMLTILAMQNDRLIKSCLAKNGEHKDRRSRRRALSCITLLNTQPCSGEQSAGSASPGRFSRRMSIRVVPDDRRLGSIEDTSFLEAYGLAASKDRKPLCTSLEKQTAGEKSLSDNVQYADSAIEFVKFERIATPRDVVLQRCNQDDYLPFRKCFPSSYIDNCRKIGEGVYGEVFLYENGEEKSVIKIIPIEGEALVNGERQKRFDEILSEIVIAKELHNLRYGGKNQTHGFAEVKNIKCIKGKYPPKLIELWKAYDDDKGSDNDCPSMFDRHQLYIVLELGHGGEDLEAFVFYSAAEAHALFVQTAVALAVAEQSLEFEHRDLHWGNVLISETEDTEVAYRLNNKEYKYPTKGLQVAIIDFTLSRMSYDGCCIFNDLASDPALFTAQGEYQFEIYRLMRDKVENNWQAFEPYTNILWLHYTLDKMMTALRYKRIYARGHREGMYCLHGLKKIILGYESAFDFVTNCEEITNLQCQSDTETNEKPSLVE